MSHHGRKCFGCGNEIDILKSCVKQLTKVTFFKLLELSRWCLRTGDVTWVHHLTLKTADNIYHSLAQPIRKSWWYLYSKMQKTVFFVDRIQHNLMQFEEAICPSSCFSDFKTALQWFSDLWSVKQILLDSICSNELSLPAFSGLKINSLSICLLICICYCVKPLLFISYRIFLSILIRKKNKWKYFYILWKIDPLPKIWPNII